MERRTITTEYMCPSCRVGFLQYTAVFSKRIGTTIKFRHECVNCPHAEYLEKKYPQYKMLDARKTNS